MEKIVKKTLALGFGISTLTQQQVNRFVKEIMKSQGITEKQAKKLAQDMIKKSKKTQQEVNKLVMDGACNLYNAAGLATKKDLDKLKRDLTKKKKRKTKAKK